MGEEGTVTVPRIVIGGVQSGAGKTTIAVGFMKALAERGLVVQGFKVGPDYIDSHAYGQATGRPGRNLDTYLMTPEQVRTAFSRGAAGADVAVIEGVMGLFDGVDGSGEVGSTAYLAKLLQAPVLLVIDAAASARSVAAVALGFRQFDPEVRLAGVICNRVGGLQHAAMLRDALATVGIPLVGALCYQGGLQMPEGRLGLSLSDGAKGTACWIAAAGRSVREQVDLDQVLDLARQAGPLPQNGGGEADPFAPAAAGRYRGLRIGVARDAAFWFYYEDTFDLLRHWGVEPVFFSPLADPELPAGIHGLYLGGGVPEKHAAALAANSSMRKAVAEACRRGLPIFAEGGGYLYLLEGLSEEDGTFHPMTGSIPGAARLEPCVQGFGYRRAEPGGIRGHLFHYAKVEGSAGPEGGGAPAWRLYRPDGTFERADGCRRGYITASFLHIHHATQPAAMDSFLAQCRDWAAGGTGRD